MTVGIVGLGLIGGSFAKAYHEAGHRVLAFDTDQSVFDFAVLSGAVDGLLSEESLSSCDLILIAVYPSAAVDYLRQHGAHIGPKPVVIDCCGTKRLVCDACFPLAKEYGFTYLGRVKELLAPAGFGRFSITTAEQHDEMIAFTSQLAHVVSNAYIKSPTAELHKGFSAGSYKDMTRVAWLAPEMWAELFLENKDFLMAELDTLMANLRQYQDAMVHNDLPGLVRLLDEGRKRKEEVDGR